MGDVNIRELAKELNLSIGTVSKALRDSYEISAETKEKVLSLAKKLNYTPNPYASSLRRKKSNTIAVVIPEVADSFFSLAIKGIETIAQDKGYHVLVYLTYESFLKEQAILNEFKSGRVDGILMSISSETSNNTHIEELLQKEMPIVFFDRVPEDVETAKVITNDFECGYLAAQHLIEKGCKVIIYLSNSMYLAISNKRMEGFKKALKDYQFRLNGSSIVQCTNNADDNYTILHKAFLKNKPDGIIASVENLITPVYLVSKDLQINIPKQLKIISFSNLHAAPILNPSLTTITQPAFDMGKTAAILLFKAIERRNKKLKNENIVLPSTLIIRESTL